MDISVSALLIDLVKTAGLIVAFAYIVTRTRFFSDVLGKQFNYKSQIIVILLFGGLSIFGTYGGITLRSGGIANIRDLGPMVAGLVGGPFIGLGAGLMGGLHRYFLGGFVAVPCCLATVMAGLLGGVIYHLHKKEFPAVWQATLFGAGMELLHMGLVLLIARPFAQALALVKDIIIPMTGANAVGIAIFALIIRNLIIERQTAVEKEKYRRELEHKEFEIETARRIQESFLPESTPRLDGFDLAAVCLPALEVGGDFYDFIPIAQDKWGFVIADVSGKGFPAALFMALSRMCVRANAMGKPNASEAIRIANNLISQDARSGMFVTMFYALLDLKHKRLNYINAGHNPPLLFQGNAGGVTLLKAKGIALGVLDDVNLEEVWLDLGMDDTVVLYTDGVTEAINKKEEPFGLERLIKLITQNKNLSAQSLVDKIKGEVTAFSQGQSQFDDITLVVLKAV